MAAAGDAVSRRAVCSSRECLSNSLPTLPCAPALIRHFVTLAAAKTPGRVFAGPGAKTPSRLRGGMSAPHRVGQSLLHGSMRVLKPSPDIMDGSHE